MGNASGFLKGEVCCDSEKVSSADGAVERIGALGIQELQPFVPGRRGSDLDLMILEALQGSWYLKSTSQRVGEVEGTLLIWDPAWALPAATMVAIADDGEGAVWLMCNANGRRISHQARLSCEAQKSLTWDDGDVWVKK